MEKFDKWLTDRYYSEKCIKDFSSRPKRGMTMKVDLYTKSILTVIAVAMVALVAQNITTPAEA